MKITHGVRLGISALLLAALLMTPTAGVRAQNGCGGPVDEVPPQSAFADADHPVDENWWAEAQAAEYEITWQLALSLANAAPAELAPDGNYIRVARLNHALHDVICVEKPEVLAL